MPSFGNIQPYEICGRRLFNNTLTGNNITNLETEGGFKLSVVRNGTKELQLAAAQPFVTPLGTVVEGKSAQVCGKRLRITNADEEYDGFDITTSSSAHDLFSVFRDSSGNAVLRMQAATGDPTQQNRINFDLTLGVASFLGPGTGLAVTTGPLTATTVTATSGIFSNLSVNGAGVQPSNANLDHISGLAGVQGSVEHGNEQLISGGTVHNHLSTNYQPTSGRLNTLAEISTSSSNQTTTTDFPSVAGLIAYVATSGGGDPDKLILAPPSGSGTIPVDRNSMTVVNAFGDITTSTTALQVNNMKLSEILTKMFFPEVAVTAPSITGSHILSDSIADPLVRVVGQAIGAFTVTYDSKLWSNGVRYAGDPTAAKGLEVKSGATLLASMPLGNSGWSPNTVNTQTSTTAPAYTSYQKWVATMPSTVTSLTSATVNNYNLTYHIYFSGGFGTTSNTGATTYAAPPGSNRSINTATLEWVVPIYYSGGTSSTDVERSVTTSFTNYSYVELALSDIAVIGQQQYFDFPDSKSGTVVIKEFDPADSTWKVPATNKYTTNTGGDTGNGVVTRVIPTTTGNSFTYKRYTYEAHAGSGSYRIATSVRVYCS